MPVTRRAQNVVLIALAILAAVTTYLAFANVRGGGTSGDELGGQNGVTAAGTDSPGSQDEDDMADDTDETTATAAPSGPADPLGAAREALAGDGEVNIAVLGDSTSNERSEWVHLWAAQLSQDRPVTISHWDEASGASYNEADVLSDAGDSGAVTIWSGSIFGAAPATAAALMPAIVPEEPDFVIYSFGHNVTLDEVDAQFDELHAAVTEAYAEVPTIVVLQNPQLDDANAEVREAVRAWAEDNELGIIDVAGEFPEPSWPWLVDEIHPSQQGQELWAATMAEALGQG